MTLFLDTNVIIDLLSKREPFYNSIAKIATLADKKELKLVVSALSFSTITYVLRKFEKQEITINKLRKFKTIIEIAPLNDEIIEKALNSNFSDFEDALQYFSAVKSKCKIIVTRNGKDFKESKIPIMTPLEYLASINKK